MPLKIGSNSGVPILGKYYNDRFSRSISLTLLLPSIPQIQRHICSLRIHPSRNRFLRRNDCVLALLCPFRRAQHIQVGPVACLGRVCTRNESKNCVTPGRVDRCERKFDGGYTREGSREVCVCSEQSCAYVDMIYETGTCNQK